MSDFGQRTLQTRLGKILLPTFFPVTTFGDKYPLDNLIRPYLPRLCQCVLVSHHYAAHLEEYPGDHPGMPLFVDSGGFALLFEGSEVIERDGVFGIRTASGDLITPDLVLQRQMRHAEIGATLDFPIPPGLEAKQERKRRLEATIANAEWALRNNRRPDLRLYASLQCWDKDSARESARSYATMHHFDRTFAGIAIGGMVPRLRDPEYVQTVVEAVRTEWDGPIHVFGVGSPTMVRNCLQWGADSTDSSSFVKYAANGRHLNPRVPPVAEEELTPLGRMQLALRNLSHLLDPATDHLPLSAVARSASLSVGGRP
ncbi:MAG: tRNA-guanine transglycosylase [Pseudohaliea sp.]|jgi:helicase